MESLSQHSEVIPPWSYVWRFASNKTAYKRTLPPKAIIDIVCVYYTTQERPMTMAHLMSRSRKGHLVLARYMIWHFFYNYTSIRSLKSIGLYFNRDHSTIINGLKKLKAYCDTEANTRQQFLDISDLLKVEEYEKIKR